MPPLLPRSHVSFWLSHIVVLLPRFQVSFWLSYIVVYLYYLQYVLAYSSKLWRTGSLINKRRNVMSSNQPLGMSAKMASNGIRTHTRTKPETYSSSVAQPRKGVRTPPLWQMWRHICYIFTNTRKLGLNLSYLIRLYCISNAFNWWVIALK